MSRLKNKIIEPSHRLVLSLIGNLNSYKRMIVKCINRIDNCDGTKFRPKLTGNVIRKLYNISLLLNDLNYLIYAES